MATYRHLDHLLRHTGLRWYPWRTPGREYQNERFNLEVHLTEYEGAAPVPDEVMQLVRSFLSEQGRMKVKEFDQWLEWELEGRFRPKVEAPLTIVELEEAEPGTVLTMQPLYPRDWVPFQGILQPVPTTWRSADSRIYLKPGEGLNLVPYAMYAECPGTDPELPYLFELHGGEVPPPRAAAQVYKVLCIAPT